MKKNLESGDIYLLISLCEKQIDIDKFFMSSSSKVSNNFKRSKKEFDALCALLEKLKSML